jgi:mannose-6-phosphate isomerase-like protein (cupin superfamily)
MGQVMGTRRVVTGQTADGTSVFVSDEQVATKTFPLLPGWDFRPVWGSDVPVALPTDGTEPAAPLYFPPPAGFRFSVFTIGAQGEHVVEGIDVAAAFADFQEQLPGMVETLEPDDPGMHTTDTVDFDYVVSGEVHLELDDGAEVLLRAGDCVIQNGTRHRWNNRSDEPCTIVVAIVGADRA